MKIRIDEEQLHKTLESLEMAYCMQNPTNWIIDDFRNGASVYIDNEYSLKVYLLRDCVEVRHHGDVYKISHLKK